MLSFVKRYFGTQSSAGARRIAILYAVFAGLWILASDYVVSVVAGRDFSFEISQTLKGLLFVATTATLLFVATRRQLQRLQRESHLRLRAEENVIENEHLFRRLFTGNPLPTWVVDRETLRFLEVNDAAQKHYGYSLEEFSDLILPDLEDKNEAGTLEEVVSATDSNDATQRRHRTKSGQQLQVEIWVAELMYGGRPSLLTVVSDITTRKHAEDELRASEEKFREITETIQEVFWVTDPRKQCLIYVSPAYERIWDRPAADLYESGTEWLEAIHPEDRPRIEAAAANQTTQPFDVEYRIIRPDGSLRWITDRAFPIRNAAGETIRVIGVAEDITSRKNAEEERRSLEAQFRQAQKMEAIGQLSAGISHDFNNLLTIIQMQTALLLEDEHRTPDDAAALREIDRATGRAAELTRQLLAFSRQQKLTRQAIELNAVIGKVTKMLRRTVGQNIQLQVDCIDTPLPMSADPGMLEQVLVNLVINARDAMPRGGTVEVTTSQVELSSEVNAAATGSKRNFACIAVKDTGSGIATEHLTRVFEPFFTTKDVGKGSGLGLAMVYGIVQQHDGWIEIETAPEQGTTFRVFLPLGQASAVEPESAPPSERLHGNGTILLLEDNEQIRKVVVTYLVQCGYRVIVATDGHDALSKWRESKSEIDLLLTDLVLPGGMDGRELAERVLEDKPTLPVIYTSGYSVRRANDDLRLIEGENFLAKPFNPRQLGNIIRQHLGTGCGPVNEGGK